MAAIGYANIESALDQQDDLIEIYFDHFKVLSKQEDWVKILEEGQVALEAAKKLNRPIDETRISLQLASTSFYRGDFMQALIYARHGSMLAEEFEDSPLFLRALYLESAAYRALASKEKGEKIEGALYLLAVEIGEKAAHLYAKNGMTNNQLKGKIYFNLGAAYADNPKGDLKKAENCYTTAIACYKNDNSIDDLTRTMIRLGKIYFLQTKYTDCQSILDEVRPFLSHGRLSMHADYLEAQLKLAMNLVEEAYKIAKSGLEKAIFLGAKEDESRLKSLLEKIKGS